MKCAKHSEPMVKLCPECAIENLNRLCGRIKELEARNYDSLAMQAAEKMSQELQLANRRIKELESALAAAADSCMDKDMELMALEEKHAALVEAARELCNDKIWRDYNFGYCRKFVAAVAALEEK